MEWFENWFDTKYYHILYKNRNIEEAEKFINNLQKRLQIPINSKILDLACGKGRFSKEFNKLGLDVTGIDLSESSISKAKEMENKTLKFMIGDMRKVYFPDFFDVIVNLFTSFGYFDTNQENFSVFETVSKQLKNNGIFVFDYLNPNYVINNLIDYEEKKIDGIEFKISKKIIDNQVIKTISFQSENQNFTFKEKVRLFNIEDILQELLKNNLVPEHIFGNYDLDYFDSDNSQRIIITSIKS